VREVLSVRREEFQVLRAVVGRVSVPMVDDLLRIEKTPEGGLHHEAMLSDVPVAIRVRMVRAKEEHIAGLVEHPPPLPRPVPPFSRAPTPRLFS